MQRDGFACVYCGALAPGAVLEIDHRVPVCLGGSSGDDNLVTACLPCNAGKANAAAPIPVSDRVRAEVLIEIFNWRSGTSYGDGDVVALAEVLAAHGPGAGRVLDLWDTLLTEPMPEDADTRYGSAEECLFACLIQRIPTTGTRSP